MTAHPSFDADGPAEAGSGIFGLTTSAGEAAVVLLPVPFEATTSYRRGTRRAPAAILAASHQLDLFDPLLGTPYEAGIAMLPEAPQVHGLCDEALGQVELARAGASTQAAVAQVNRICEALNGWVREQAAAWLARDRVVGTLGGDHAVAFGAITAHLERFPRLGVLQVDAHADLRLAFEGFTWSHASVMRNLLERTSVAKLVQIGVRDLSPGEARYAREQAPRVATFFDTELAASLLAGASFGELLARVIAELPAEVYVSFDIDGLDPGLCPNTGTPVPGGLSFHQATALLAAITRSGRRVVGFDLTEVAPAAGELGESWDANVGARILYQLCGHALVGR